MMMSKVWIRKKDEQLYEVVLEVLDMLELQELLEELDAFRSISKSNCRGREMYLTT